MDISSLPAEAYLLFSEGRTWEDVVVHANGGLTPNMKYMSEYTNDARLRLRDLISREPDATIKNGLKRTLHNLQITFSGGRSMLFIESIKSLGGVVPNIAREWNMTESEVEAAAQRLINIGSIFISNITQGTNITHASELFFMAFQAQTAKEEAARNQALNEQRAKQINDDEEEAFCRMYMVSHKASLDLRTQQNIQARETKRIDMENMIRRLTERNDAASPKPETNTKPEHVVKRVEREKSPSPPPSPVVAQIQADGMVSSLSSPTLRWSIGAKTYQKALPPDR